MIILPGPDLDPLEAARRLAGAPGRWILHSASDADGVGRWSFAGITAEFSDLTLATHLTPAGVVTPERRRGVQTDPRVIAEVLEQLHPDGPPSHYMKAR